MHIISSIICLALLGFVVSVIGAMLVSFRHKILTALIAAPAPKMTSRPDFSRVYALGDDVNRANVARASSTQPERLALAA